jgi:N-acetylmuramoyl-L-alanine amidase
MKKIIFLILLLSLNCIAQDFSKIKISVGSISKELTAYKKGGLNFISIKEFAEAFNAGYFFNTSNSKAELKFNNYILKVTANNPFLILTKKEDNSSEAIQLPTVAIVLKNQTYIPLEYTAGVLSTCLENEIKYPGGPKETVKIENKKSEVENKKEEMGNITSLKFSSSEKANGTLLTIQSNREIDILNHAIFDDTIIISLPRVKLDLNKNVLSFAKGLAKEIELQNLDNEAIIKISLREDFSTYEVIHNNGDKEILVTLHSKKFEKNNSEVNPKKEKWNFDVIVLDAGHGGQDYGAIGVDGAVEKEINLAIALKLGKLISKNLPDIKVVYTREDDRFIELYQRGKIANENNGKLFISIHCNSTPQKPGPANGFEIYLLRPGKTEDAIAIAERENSVIQYEDDPSRYQKLTDENFILVSMASSSYMKYSERFAELLDKHLSSNIKENSRGVRQAGFYVLVGASMPSVLIETGFISNHDDALYLKSKEGQNEIAQSIFNAIKSFKEYYEKVIENE